MDETFIKKLSNLNFKLPYFCQSHVIKRNEDGVSAHLQVNVEIYIIFGGMQEKSVGNTSSNSGRTRIDSIERDSE